MSKPWSEWTMREKLTSRPTIEATFAPLRQDDLKPGMEAWVGQRVTLIPVWDIESGDYEGQVAYLPPPKEEHRPRFWWIPECDLRDVEVME